MRTLYKPSRAEFEIKRSIFIGRAYPVTTEEEAQAIIEDIRKAEPQATHHCYAYTVGPKQRVQRYSDDGEPSGTAGVPMLEVLKKREIEDVLVLVTRYFGGKLLGAGGLVRAYTQGAAEALDAGKTVDKLICDALKLSVDYTHLGKLDYIIQTKGYDEIERSFDERAHVRLIVKEEDLAELTSGFLELTSGQEPVKDGAYVCYFHEGVLLDYQAMEE